jgi:hypothetical protein
VLIGLLCSTIQYSTVHHSRMVMNIDFFRPEKNDTFVKVEKRKRRSREKVEKRREQMLLKHRRDVEKEEK